MNSRGVQFSEWLVWLVLAGLAALTTLKLGNEFYRLVCEEGTKGAIDLALRYFEIQHWFDGRPVYGANPNATYPPASYLVLWPLAGWASLEVIRWFWLLLSIASLAWLVWLLLRECDVRTWPERLLIALVPLSMNATGIAIGNGQPAFFLIPILLMLLVVTQSGQTGWKTELGVALLMVMALLKPTFSAPFFLIILLASPGPRAAFICVAGYLLLTFVSTLFQPQDMITLLGEWFRSSVQTNVSAAVDLDYGSVHSWLTHAGLSRWNAVASFLWISCLAIWIYRVRRVDLWLIFGVTALIARTWAYHGLYDDMLIIIPIIAVFRHSRALAGDGPIDRASLLILSGSVFVMALPARLFNLWESPWPVLFAISHLFFWLLLMVWLVIAAERQNRQIPGH